MDLRDFYRLILRNLLIVLLSTLLGVSVAGAITFLTTPLYESKIQLFVSTQSGQADLSALIQGSSFSQQRVKSYAQIINSPTVLEPVIERLNLSITAEKFSKRVKASAPLDTVLINVTALDESPILAARIADAIGENFSEYVNQLELAESNGQPPIKVSLVKRALVPSKPSTPRVELNLLLGILLGFGLGIGISILRQLFDTTIKNESDLNDYPLLAAVGLDKEAVTKPLLHQLSRYSARTESFRQLRTNLQYLRAENSPRIIGITSALPGEGKTSTALNLSISLAQAGFKVTLIESDLRRPKVSKYLDINTKSRGLSEYLSESSNGWLEEEVAAISHQVAIEPPFLYIHSGKIPVNPAELLDSRKFEELLLYLRTTNDYVIVDCAPALPVADATIVSTRVDGMIVVVEAGSTKRNQFQGVVSAIANVGGQILGVMLNKIPFSRSYDDYGYRYGYGYRGKYRYYQDGYRPNPISESQREISPP